MKGMKKSNSITNIASTNHSKEHEKNRESGIKSLARVYDGNQKWLNNNTSLSYPIFASSSFFLQIKLKFITGHLSSPSLSKFSYFWSNYWNDNVKYVSQSMLISMAAIIITLWQPPSPSLIIISWQQPYSDHFVFWC